MPPRLGEADLIARYFAPLAGPAGLGLRDDAALMRPPPGQDLVLTTDALVAGVHFFADDPPGAIARKALRVNLSDLAAKGARPLGFLLALALPATGATNGSRPSPRVSAPTLGLRLPADWRRHGRDAGAVDAERDRDRRGCARADARRTGVRPGDRLYVSGTIGDAAIGLEIRQGRGLDIPPADKAFLLERYLTPQPRLALIGAMAAYASGGMDVSDGFVGDLAKMLRRIGGERARGARRLPLSPAARAAIAADPALFEVAATGGDDYELLASAPRVRGRLRARGRGGGRAVDVVGEAVEGRRPPGFIGPDGNPVVFARGAYSHF